MKDILRKLLLYVVMPIGTAALVYFIFWFLGILLTKEFPTIQLPPKTYSADKIYDMAAPSVVEIHGTSSDGEHTGTGFFYDEEGTVITNYHVIEDCTAATITTSTGAEYEVVSVLGYDESIDIAVLDTRCKKSKPLPFRTDEIKTGETVYAIGSSLGLTGTLSDGIVSTAAREVEGHYYIQTTAPISEGNSGGPLIDVHGQVVGITTASFVEGQNLNLAIPIARVADVPRTGPIDLKRLFKPKVEWLFDGDFLYYDDEDTYVVFFQIGDKDYTPITCSGEVRIVITNGDDKVVYRKIMKFDESDYSTWTLRGVEDKTLVALYIDPEDITKGSTPYGTVSLLVYSDEFSFNPLTIDAYDLPTK